MVKYLENTEKQEINVINRHYTKLTLSVYN